jgi:phosphatidylinositol N-acetylglucosaminyltransferase subunit C
MAASIAEHDKDPESPSSASSGTSNGITLQGKKTKDALAETKLSASNGVIDTSYKQSSSITSAPSSPPGAAPLSPSYFANGGGSMPFPYDQTSSTFSPRNQQRLATAKSAILIYCTLLGLSPILKSLTKSTTSDSIWAMSCWLMCINVFFFDYGGEVGVK